MTKTYDTACYDLAAHFLEDHPHLNDSDRNHDLAAALQKLVDEFIADANANYDGAPYCSYGHKTKESCDCGPIADNE